MSKVAYLSVPYFKIMKMVCSLPKTMKIDKISHTKLKNDTSIDDTFLVLKCNVHRPPPKINTWVFSFKFESIFYLGRFGSSINYRACT